MRDRVAGPRVRVETDLLEEVLSVERAVVELRAARRELLAQPLDDARRDIALRDQAVCDRPG